MLNTTNSRIFIAPRRQARKERVLLISPNLGVFARVTVFPILLAEIPLKISNMFG
jgi:hypothetical protein